MGKRIGVDVTQMNPYEKARMMRVEECRSRLKDSGIAEIKGSLANLVDSKRNKKRKYDARAPGDARDPDYSPERESFGDKDDDEERQTSIGGKATKKSGKNKDQPECEQRDDESGTRTDKQLAARKPMTRATAQSQQYVPPMMLKKFLAQSKKGQKVGGGSGKRKAPTMAQLILKNQQPEKEAALTTLEPLVGSSENQSPNDQNLRWLTDLDEGRHVDGDEDDEREDQPENDNSDEEDFFDSDNDEMDYESEEEGYEDREQEHCNGNNDIECANTEIQAQGSTRRGPTMMHEVHMRPPEQRESIFLNEYGQPVGPVTPEKDTVGQFSRFLGTIARCYDNAPLTHKTWKSVPRKEKLWEYVLTKYIVPEEGKDWVLKTIGAAWRVYKCRFKKKHYRKYNTNKLRWLNRPKTVPEKDFKQLLILWNKKELLLFVESSCSNKKAEERCAANQSRRKAQKNNHTVGPKSFARIREDMKNEDPDKQPPSLVKMFERTRQRNEKRKYTDTYEDTAKKIEAMKNFQPNEDGSGPKDAFLSVMNKDYPGRRRLYGRGVTNKVLNKGHANAISYVVPTEVMEKLRADMEAQNTQVADIKKDLEADYQEKMANLDADYAKKMEDLEKSKQLMVQEVLEKVLAKLPADVVRDYLTS